MRAPIILLAPVVALYQIQTVAADVSEKQCVFEAASKVPKLPGLAITAVKADRISASTAIAYYAKTANYHQSKKILNHFGALSVRTEERLRTFLLNGLPTEVAETFRASIKPAISGAYSVKITVSAIKRTAVFDGICLLGKHGRSYIENVKLSQ